MFAKLKAVIVGLIYLFAPVSLVVLGLGYGAAMAGKTAALFVRDYVEYFATEWIDDLRLRVFWPLRDFYFAQIANRLIGLMALLALPGFVLAHLIDGFRHTNGFQGFLVEFNDDIADIRRSIVNGNAL